MDHPIQSRRVDLMWTTKKRKKTYLVDFYFLTDHGMKMKKIVKVNKYLDLAKELKKPQDMKVTVIPVVVGALGTIPWNWERNVEELEIRGRIKTLQATEPVKVSWNTEKNSEVTCCHLDFSEKPQLKMLGKNQHYNDDNIIFIFSSYYEYCLFVI